ncbi:MAG: hypothetical protein GXP29_08580, partial [Planctomycetes bacterium]|nr:hypothetical protein [Planctomycetota bacterium]
MNNSESGFTVGAATGVTTSVLHGVDVGDRNVARCVSEISFAGATRVIVAGVLALWLYAPSFALALDCNFNGVDDAVDIAVGTSLDCDDNGVPDECQVNIVSENFNSYSPGQDPANWFDTAAGSSTVELDNFDVRQVGSDLALGVFSTSTNIHSHYVGTGAANISSMIFTGRMRIAESGGGIGVTFLSQFSDQPSSTYEYLRIRRASYAPSAQTFHLAPPNFDNFTGVVDSGVNPSA